MGWFTAARRGGGGRNGTSAGTSKAANAADGRANAHVTSDDTAWPAKATGDANARDETHVATDEATETRAATDRRLIRAIVRHSSQEAADQLVRAYFDDVCAFIWRTTGDRDHALDLTQETMIAVLRALSTYDPAKASVRTWMYAIASRKVIDARRAQRITTTPLDPRPSTDTGIGTSDIVGNAIANGTAEPVAGTKQARDPAESQADADLLARIETFVSRFDAGTQEIFHLHTAAGLTFPQIAQARGERTEAVKARYYRLIQAIRKEFGDERAD
ncbi:RNA polymerase sigma factor [Bifidobacterium miconisargentati]|uniref:RNA polymerase sigma factor n=1 Tax=Bifidobacterium miconisargentati TaxID=2834437 RepID=UPI001BDBCD67|nr:sigma-70 family RNA polymerase sigma factor [Bifidobacterium miconisargentati]MBW3090525.1 sigma-70 family RNA polymerase sigma factor [Bifidobacterium miconisargentati]